jgi:hypothetical protein
MKLFEYTPEYFLSFYNKTLFYFFHIVSVIERETDSLEYNSDMSDQ